jgi:hypothetical protein
VSSNVEVHTGTGARGQGRRGKAGAWRFPAAAGGSRRRGAGGRPPRGAVAAAAYAPPAHLAARPAPAENDLEMLRLARLGVAMGNAGPAVKAAAAAVVASNDDDGVAQAVEEYVLAPRRIAAT